MDSAKRLTYTPAACAVSASDSCEKEVTPLLFVADFVFSNPCGPLQLLP